jgi:DNA-binding GntR family transcriptional regulator
MSGLEGVVLRRSTTAQQVADALSERILAGAFPPGDRLRESAIATELGIARNTVREAVRILQLGGLVRHEVNRGAVVISPTADNVEALYTARERLETAAVARQTTPKQREVVEHAFQALSAATRTHEVRLIVEKDLDFHAAIVALLDSSRLNQFFADLSRELRYYLIVLSVTDSEAETPEAILAEHEPIATAIAAGDRDGAVEAVRTHIEANARRLREILETTQRPTSAPPRS